MSRVVPREPSAESLARAAGCLLSGGVAAFRTDTLYGLSAAWSSAAGLARLRAIKGEERPFLSLAADAATAWRWSGPVEPWVRAVADRFWPGPVTLVLPAGPKAPAGARAPDGSWAVRVPDEPWCRELAARVGGALPSTSANRPGGSAARTVGEVQARLGDTVDLVVDGGPVPQAQPASALVDCRGGGPVLLRGGPAHLVEFLHKLAGPSGC